MLANLGDAVASLTKSSEDIDTKMAQAESGVRQLTESASTFRTSVTSIQGAVDQSLTEMARTTNQLATALDGRRTEMESVIRDADEQLKGIQHSIEETRQLVSQHVQRISAGYEALKQRADAAPAALSQAVEHLGATQATVLARITQSLSALDTGAKKITTDIQAVQEAAHAERGRATQAVENLSKAIASLQPDVSAALVSRSKDARVVVDALGDKLNELLRDDIHKPINDLRTQTRDALQKAVNEKTDEATRRIIDEGLGFLLKGVAQAQEDSSGITRELKKLIPGQIDRAKQDLGYILEHIDEILKILGKLVTHKFEKAVDQGIDWLSQKTGVDLSGLKVVNHAVVNNLNAGIDLVADSGKLVVDTFIHPENTLKNLKTVGKDVIQVVATFPPVALARTAVSAIAPKIARVATAGFDAIGRHLPPAVKKALAEQASRARAVVAQGASVLRHTVAQSAQVLAKARLAAAELANQTRRKAVEAADRARKAAQEHIDHAARAAREKADQIKRATEEARRKAAEAAERARKAAAEAAERARKAAAEAAERARRAAAEAAARARRAAAEAAERARRAAAEAAERARRKAAEEASRVAASAKKVWKKIRRWR